MKNFKNFFLTNSFIKRIIAQAKNKKKKILLVEGEDVRVLQAGEYCQKKGIASIALMGNQQKIINLARKKKIDLMGIEIIEKRAINLFTEYSELINGFSLKQQEFIKSTKNLDLAWACLKLLNKEVDGVVCGAVYSTSDSLQAAFKIIRLEKGYDFISSFFIMLLERRVLFFADCAVNIKLTAQQLQKVAEQTVQSIQRFKIKPRVAFLSYSTGDSGSGEEVSKVKKAYQLFKKKNSFICDGPIQFDAAVDPHVSAQKIKKSQLQGKANVFIFPDLNSGNITYKAVQRLGNAIAIGPILQGVAAPFNDLSRGAEVEDIILTLVITALQ